MMPREMVFRRTLSKKSTWPAAKPGSDVPIRYVKPILAPPPPTPEESLPFEELYARFRDELPEAFRRLRVFGPDAEDCVQLALERMWQRVATFPRELTPARILVLSIAASVAKAHRTREARRARHHADDDPSLVPNGIDEAAVARWFHFAECVGELEPSLREVFIEHDIEGHPTSRIARAMNTTESIVRFRLSKARAQLRDALGKDDEERKSSRGAVVPLFGAGLGLTNLDRAVLSALFRAEGRQPLVGGPSEPPTPPPPKPPPAAPTALPVLLSLTPKAIAAVLGAFVALGAGGAAVLAFLFGIPRARPELAQSGLHVPPIPQVCLGSATQAPAMNGGASSPSSASPHPPAAPASPPRTLDADALSRGRKRLPTFSLSNPKPK